MTQTLETLWDENETCNMKHTDDDEQRDHKSYHWVCNRTQLPEETHGQN